MSEHLLSETLPGDLARCLHLIGLALGLGVGLFADLRFLRFLFQPFGESDLALFENVHRTVGWALLLLWISGLWLLALRTGFQPQAFTPKLFAKLAVVSILTVNALLMARLALPVLDRMVGWHMGDMPFFDRLRLTVVGALSAASWVAALCLGVFAAFRSMSAEQLTDFFGAMYGIALGAGILTAIAVRYTGRGVRRRRIGRHSYRSWPA